ASFITDHIKIDRPRRSMALLVYQRIGRDLEGGKRASSLRPDNAGYARSADCSARPIERDGQVRSGQIDDARLQSVARLTHVNGVALGLRPASHEGPVGARLQGLPIDCYSGPGERPAGEAINHRPGNHRASVTGSQRYMLSCIAAVSVRDLDEQEICSSL